MKRQILFQIIYLCSICIVHGQQRHANTHSFRPGLSFGYLPTWELDDFYGNTRANVFMTGINGYWEFRKESVFIFGITRGILKADGQTEHISVIAPLKLQKFFTPDRKGFNLTFGFLMGYCKTCDEPANGAFSNEISYLFSFDPLHVNVGIQTMLGGFFDGPAIYFGPQLQVIWHPQDPKVDR